MAEKKKEKVAAKSLKEGDLVADVLDGIHEDLGGEEYALLLGADSMALKIRGVISTQCPGLDAAIGRGGVPLGRLTLLHGKEASGKTTIALQIVAECQENGGLAVYFDMEYKLDPDYAEALGVDKKKLIISQPPSLEKVIDGIKSVVASVKKNRIKSKRRKPVVIVVDSMNACIAEAVLKAETDKHHIAPEARVWSRNLPAIIAACSKEDIALVFISQVRAKIGVMFGDKSDLAGGNAPKFFASLILKITRIGTEKVGGEKAGNKIEGEPVKNQIGPPFRKAEFLIRYGTGVDYEQSLLKWYIKEKLVKKKGAWLSYDGNKLGEGVVKSCEVLREDEKLRALMIARFKKKMGWI